MGRWSDRARQVCWRAPVTCMLAALAVTACGTTAEKAVPPTTAALSPTRTSSVAPTPIPTPTANPAVAVADHPYVCQAIADGNADDWQDAMAEWQSAGNITDGAGPNCDIPDPWNYPMDFNAGVAFLTLYDDVQNIDIFQISGALQSAIASAVQTYKGDLAANAMYIGGC